MIVVCGPIRMLRWCRTPSGRYVPTRSKSWAFEAPCSVLTGEIVEPKPGGGWQVAAHPPPHDPAAVLAWFRREQLRDQERREQRERERVGSPTYVPDFYPESE